MNKEDDRVSEVIVDKIAIRIEPEDWDEVLEALLDICEISFHKGMMEALEVVKEHGELLKKSVGVKTIQFKEEE